MKGYKLPPKRIKRPDKPTSAPPPKLEGKMSDSQIYEAVERERNRRGEGCPIRRSAIGTSFLYGVRL